MVALQLIAQLGVVERLAGQQALDQLGAAALGAAAAPLGLLGVGVGDGREQAVDERRLGAQQALQLGRAEHLGALGLLDHEVASSVWPAK